MGQSISQLVFQPPRTALSESSASYLNPNAYFHLTHLSRTDEEEAAAADAAVERGRRKGEGKDDEEEGVGMNRVAAFFMDRNADVTILFSHSNAEDLGLIYDYFADFSRRVGVNLLAYDYSGYGYSTGTASEQATYADIEAAYHYLTVTRGIPPEQIVLYGRSLGSGPSCYLAQRLCVEQGVRLGGLILQSPLTSIFRVAFDFRFTLPGDMFPNIDRVADITCPTLVIHGTRDEIVPFTHGEELFLALPSTARAKPFWVDGAGHNNIETLLRDTAAFYERVLEFLDAHVLSKRPVSAGSTGSADGAGGVAAGRVNSSTEPGSGNRGRAPSSGSRRSRAERGGTSSGSRSRRRREADRAAGAAKKDGRNIQSATLAASASTPSKSVVITRPQHDF